MRIINFKNSLPFITLLLSLLLACSTKNIAHSASPDIKNVILLIGDGMGTAQVYAAMLSAKDKLNLERSKAIGFCKTYSLTDLITDSGAGATAFATGRKTKNYAISVDTLDKPLKTLVEYAEENSMATGIVTTCNLTHATPAAFVAHQPSRYYDTAIAMSYLNLEVDILIGGGKTIFDGLNITQQLKNRGYEVFYDLKLINKDSKLPLLCLTADDHPESYLKGRGELLPNSVGIALNKLMDKSNGFFLMVEGSQIDWGGHAKDIDYIVSEVLDFDKAVGVAYDFADNNPGTLVIVTADHETGGLTLPGGNLHNKTIIGKFSTGHHSAVMVPVFAYGDGAENFSQIMENTDIFYKIMNALQLNP